MGTPNNYNFNCPNCGCSMYTQGLGHCSTYELAMTCECNLNEIVDNEETCKHCGIVINFKSEQVLRKSICLTPQIKNVG